MPPHASSVSRARALLRQALSGVADGMVDSAQLAVSEVVTNALVHAGTEVHLRARLDEKRLRVEVTDGSPHLPSAREHSVASGTGRGLHMVEESVDAWGSFPRGDGKVVWFEIRASGATSGRVPDRADPQSPHASQPTSQVVLLNVPLLMHLAWQEHASALLREFLLTGLEADEVAAFARHASASEAMSLLHEQVPVPELLDDPEAIMTTAVEPRVSAEKLVVDVPRSMVADFDTLDGMLTEATALAETGALLVPPTQPEVVAMRRWLCDQVRQQSLGLSDPHPWSSYIEDRRPNADDAEWRPDFIAGAESALLAMDEAGRVVAVSRRAAELLGYSSPDQLLWQPLLSIVPARYHQAHVAGTTLHMVNGRSPLLGKRVTVPVVLADGIESALDLEVQPRRQVDGRHVFVAEFFDQGIGSL